MIKKLLVVFSFILSSTILSQENNSLLWKISGNNLEKDSYLYGTMHVSQKIAFHLDDVFYESLLKSDFVGLESDPSTWLEHSFNSSQELSFFRGGDYRNKSDFYNSPFKFLKPKQQELMFYLSREDMLLNGILYRTNKTMQDFQEETYLDMFIYQSGKKFGKKIFSLEDYETSSMLVKKATSSRDMVKRPADLWLQKKLKDENFVSLMNNAYRDRKVEFLDSINKGMYNDSYMKNMLYIRNNNIANSIDSIVKKGSLFSAVGAAHLGGEQGVISLLRKKGYTVKPLTSLITDKAKQLKTTIEDKTLKVNYYNQTTDDGFISADLPSKLYELNLLNNTSYLCPDLSNGAYIIITRISTFSFIHGEEVKDKNFDKILNESIPGKIISKVEIEKQGIKGLDIVNQTKSGNFQRYQIFFTPLEIIILKMHGQKEYTKKFGDAFFNSIKFNNLTSNFTTVSPTYKGFKVDVPGYHNFTNIANIGDRIIQAIDTSGAYYFVKEVNLQDITYIEEDAFELERIQERFYKNLELVYEKGKFTDQTKKSFTSKSKLKNNKNLFLKTVTNGSQYFLLGYISKNEENKDKFFNSFKIIDKEYAKDSFSVKKDTALYFTVNTNVKPTFNSYNTYNRKRKKYSSLNKSTSYINKANEKVFVTLNKYHDLASYDNLDSLWKDNTYSTKPFKFISKKYNKHNKYKKFLKSNINKGVDVKGNQYYSYYLKDSFSSKAVKVKHVLTSGAIYTLKTLVDTTFKETKFINEFYKTFKPVDTILGPSLLKNKTTQFFKALKAKDSLALSGYRFVNFTKKDSKELIDILKTYNFEDNQLEIKEYLIQELGVFNTPKVEAFLEELYIKSFKNPNNQIAIVNSIAKAKTKSAYQKLLKLFEKDVPLTSNKYQMNSMLNSFKDSLLVAKHLFPEILNYSTIEEYKKPIYTLLNDIIDKKTLTPKIYEGFKKQILNQARIELKRQLGKKDTYSYNAGNSGALLENYVKLLYPFRKDKNVQVFLKNVKFVENASVKATLIALQVKNSDTYDKSIFTNLVEDFNSRGLLFEKLHAINKTKLFPKKYLTKEEIYKAILFKSNKKVAIKDSIVFLEKRTYKNKKGVFEAYFYKSKSNKVEEYNTYKKEWKLNYIIVENDKNEISIDPIVEIKDSDIEQTKKMAKIIDDIIETKRLVDRKRVNLTTRNYNSFGY